VDKEQGVPIQSEVSLKPVFRIEENRREKNKYMPKGVILKSNNFEDILKECNQPRKK
jgi:hypothetical protein